MSRIVSALYVDSAAGGYLRREAVDVYGWATKNGAQRDAFAIDRDGTRFEGPSPVIAHPPCGPWGRFAWNYKGGEGAKGCALRAVEQIRLWGGLLEHPAGSKLWDAMGMPAPGEPADRWGGTTILVNQVDWGHQTVKPTWVYSVGVTAWPAMPPKGTPTHCITRAHGDLPLPELPKKLRHVTPPAFAEWLMEAARSVRRPAVAKLYRWRQGRTRTARAWNLYMSGEAREWTNAGASRGFWCSSVRLHPGAQTRTVRVSFRRVLGSAVVENVAVWW